jgi:hypothetical protein
MAFLHPAIAAFRHHRNPHLNLTQEQSLHLSGSTAIALIVWKVTEVLLRKYAKNTDDKTCKFIGCCAAMAILIISVLFMP